MPSLLSSLAQQDFSAGMFQAGEKLRIPPNAVFDASNALIANSGSLYRRGGGVRKGAAVGSIDYVWDGEVAAGRRTLVGANGVRGFHTLAADDATWVNHNDPSSLNSLVSPFAPALVGGVLFIPSSSGSLSVYGGSLKTAAYSTGTVTVTKNSATVMGAGTAWGAAIDSGMLLALPPDGAVGVVGKVVSDTQLTLTKPWPYATAAGHVYTLYDATNGSVYINFDPANPRYGNAPNGYAPIGSVANRLMVVAPSPGSTSNRFLTFSGINDPWNFGANDWYEFPTVILGFAVLRQTLFVFTDGGVYVIMNMAMSLVDAQGNPQQRRELVNAELILWGPAGIASWQNALIIPALDGIWIMQGIGQPTRISDRIADLYLGYVAAGCQPGVATVFNRHYVLPIMDGSGVWVDTLVARLMPTSTGTAFGWARLAGTDGSALAFAHRPSDPPLLLQASRSTGGYLVDCTAFFSPTAANKNDSDGSTHQLSVTTRDFTAGGMMKGLFKKIRARYELVDAAADNPTIDAAYATGNAAPTLIATPAGNGGVSDGTGYSYWDVVKNGIGMRFRLRTQGPCASFVLRALEVLARPSRRQ